MRIWTIMNFDFTRQGVSPETFAKASRRLLSGINTWFRSERDWDSTVVGNVVI